MTYAYSGFKNMSLLCCLTMKTLTINASPFPLQPIIKKQSHKLIEWAQTDVRPQ